MDDPESIAQGAVERLSEDESLRGNLTDDGFNPLLLWASEAAIAYAKNIQSGQAGDLMDKYASRLKGVMQAVVFSAQAGKVENPDELLDFETPRKAELKLELAGLKLDPDADQNAVKLTAVLEKGLQPGPGPEPTPPGTRSSPSPAPSSSKATSPVTSPEAPGNSRGGSGSIPAGNPAAPVEKAQPGPPGPKSPGSKPPRPRISKNRGVPTGKNPSAKSVSPGKSLIVRNQPGQ